MKAETPIRTTSAPTAIRIASVPLSPPPPDVDVEVMTGVVVDVELVTGDTGTPGENGLVVPGRFSGVLDVAAVAAGAAWPALLAPAAAGAQTASIRSAAASAALLRLLPVTVRSSGLNVVIRPLALTLGRERLLHRRRGRRFAIRVLVLNVLLVVDALGVDRPDVVVRPQQDVVDGAHRGQHRVV